VRDPDPDSGSGATPSGQVLRSDRIGLYIRYGWEGKLPIWTPEYGDFWVTDAGELGFTRVSWTGTSWSSTLPDVTDVCEVSRRTSLRCSRGAAPDRLVDFCVEDRRYTAFFTGIVRFRSGIENVVAHIPGVHHAGAIAVGIKSGWDNRGTADRGREARRIWWGLLTGATQPAQLDPASDAGR
jgi:hypothetical protein